jgi:O-antigen/teichoic acid export membrane protein
MVIGEQLVHLLYDSRYSQAGWMLQILCIRLLMTAILVGGSSCLFVLGHSRYSFIQNLARATWILAGIPIIWPLYGIEGVVWVVGLTEIPVLFVVWFAMAKHGILSVKHELRTLPIIGAGLLFGFALLQLPIGRT